MHGGAYNFDKIFYYPTYYKESNQTFLTVNCGFHVMSRHSLQAELSASQYVY